ncbi:MAG: P-loop NTPase fold protein [Chlorobiales bacterium]|nr:P-loop NTPase fold protein [Chlorobiales bacterium]
MICAIRHDNLDLKSLFLEVPLSKTYSDPKSYLYVSLYGMRSVEDIESEYFRQIHPFLSSKKARLFGRIVKGALKTAINIDFNDDGKADGSISVGIPNESIFEKIQLSDDKLLIFDDLERCSISITDLLGYINQYIEHGGFKVLMLSNESEIISKQDNDKNPESQAYIRIKEKVIGRSFEVLPELENALSYFSACLPSELPRKLIFSHMDVVARAYENSKFKNLRMLRHSLWDFDRLCGGIDPVILKCAPLIADLLYIFLAYSFEIRSGIISASDLEKFSNSSSFAREFSKNKDDSVDKLQNIRKKYPSLDLHEELIPVNVWITFFSTGSIPSEDINLALNNSKYFRSEGQQPTWVKCWHGFDLSDEEFATVFAQLQQEWAQMHYTNPGEVMHIAGMLIEHSKSGLYEKSIDSIVKEAQTYIDWLKQEGHIKPISTLHRELFDGRAYAGLGFNSLEDDNFKLLRQYLEVQRGRALEESYPEEAERLLSLIKTDPELFLQSLILSNNKENRFYKTPILPYIDPNKFIAALIDAEPSHRRTVSYVFAERYKFADIAKELLSELSWLKEVYALLEKEIVDRSGKISSFSLERFILPNFFDGIQLLDKVKV